jgi:hypothetical protein
LDGLGIHGSRVAAIFGAETRNVDYLHPAEAFRCLGRWTLTWDTFEVRIAG